MGAEAQLSDGHVACGWVVHRHVCLQQRRHLQCEEAVAYSSREGRVHAWCSAAHHAHSEQTRELIVAVCCQTAGSRGQHMAHGRRHLTSQPSNKDPTLPTFLGVWSGTRRAASLANARRGTIVLIPSPWKPPAGREKSGQAGRQADHACVAMWHDHSPVQTRVMLSGGGRLGCRGAASEPTGSPTLTLPHVPHPQLPNSLTRCRAPRTHTPYSLTAQPHHLQGGPVPQALQRVKARLPKRLAGAQRAQQLPLLVKVVGKDVVPARKKEGRNRGAKKEERGSGKWSALFGSASQKGKHAASPVHCNSTLPCCQPHRRHRLSCLPRTCLHPSPPAPCHTSLPLQWSCCPGATSWPAAAPGRARDSALRRPPAQSAHR